MTKLSTNTDISTQISGEKNITTYFEGVTVNSKPTMNDITIDVTQDTTYNFVAGDITGGFTDTEGDDPLNIKIVSLPARGILQYSGVDVVMGQEIPYSGIANLSYIPPTGAEGDQYTSFKIQVNDDGLSPHPYSDISKVYVDILGKTPPRVNDNKITIINTQTRPFALGDFSVDFQDDVAANPVEVIIKKSLWQGSLTYNAVEVTPPLTILAANIGLLEYSSNGVGTGLAFDTINFAVTDNDGLESDIRQICFDVVSLPVEANYHDTEYVYNKLINLEQLILDNYSNLDGSPLNEIEITYIHAGYDLLLLGVPVIVTQKISRADLANLTFQVNNPASAGLSVNFTFKVKSDYGQWSTLSGDFTFTVGQIADWWGDDFDGDDFDIR